MEHDDRLLPPLIEKLHKEISKYLLVNSNGGDSQFPLVLAKDNSNKLQIHPDLFSPELSLYRLPFMEIPADLSWPVEWQKIA